ncbi:DUF5615 family PIN-like protein [Candidatus Palauibacter sp.]|uniref:DUF5615 family PIN-like protein n=1 Tax=Candidatus Palauibacter sp. TaxID=3101350 RepID=UPI003B59799E
MKVLFDENVSPRLVAALSDVFPESVHVREKTGRAPEAGAGRAATGGRPRQSRPRRWPLAVRAARARPGS